MKPIRSAGSGPFGPAAFEARARTSILPASSCVSPLRFFENLTARTELRGAALMESAAQGAPAGIRSLVIPGGVVRVVIREGRAFYTPLSQAGNLVLDALAPRLDEVDESDGTVIARFPTGPGEPHLSDEERVRAPSVLDAIRVLVGLVRDREVGRVPPPGVYGAFSHELVDQWEELPGRAPDPLGEPDASFVLALDAVYYDHLRGEVQVTTRSITKADAGEAEARHDRYREALTAENEVDDGSVSEAGSTPSCLEKEAESDVTDQTFLASVDRFLHHIRAGDIFQGVLSRGLSMRSDAAPLTVYRKLQQQNPSPYMFYLDLGDGVLLGASPETCVKVEEGQLEIRPIAGTAPRGILPDGTIDEDLDGRLAVRLLLDDKEQAEHVMLVDLARNDVARVCVPGTRRVTDPFFVERYSHVQHLVSRVKGTLQPGLDALHAYRASANMGTLTGAPKLRAMELIRDNEPHARGYYGGAVGYLLQDGTFDSCIVIRSLRYKDGTYLTRAGAGIVADSVPERELAETNHKARACCLAVALAEQEQPAFAKATSRPRRSPEGEVGRVLVLDNRDSFVFNLVDEFRRRGAEVLTIRSQIILEQLEAHLSRFEPDLVVISPGPGRPEEAGIIVPWLRTRPRVPVLGICLGHQAVVVAAGGRVGRAPHLVHGRASHIRLSSDPIFRGIDSSFVAGRYHSLIATELPEELGVIATTLEDDAGEELVMGIRHRHLCQVGLQFHPESILTPEGGAVLWRFLEEARSHEPSDTKAIER